MEVKLASPQYHFFMLFLHLLYWHAKFEQHLKLHLLQNWRAHYVIVERDWPNLACLVNLNSVLWFQLYMHFCPLHDRHYMYLGLPKEPMVTQCFNVNLHENMRDLFCIWNVKNNLKVQVTIKGINGYKVQVLTKNYSVLVTFMYWFIKYQNYI